MDAENKPNLIARLSDLMLYSFIGLIIGLSLHLLGLETVGQAIATVFGLLAAIFLVLTVLTNLFIAFFRKL